MTISKNTLQYGRVACSPEGVIFSAQSAAGRTKKAAVLVRYASAGSSGEIVYEHTSKFEALWVSRQGHCHAVSKDGFHHSNESGLWKKTKIAKESILGIGGVDDSLYASAWAGQMYVRNAGAWAEVLVGGERPGKDLFGSFAGSASDDVYAWSDSSLLHFDGREWKRQPVPVRGPGTIIALSRDEVVIVSHFGLARGNARHGFAVVATSPDADAPLGEMARVVGKLQHAALFRGELYVAGTGKNGAAVFRWTGAELVPVPCPSPGVWSLAGGPLLCATGAHEGILTYDGASWSVTK